MNKVFDTINLDYKGKKVRAINDNNEVMFLLFDVCEVFKLSYSSGKELKQKLIKRYGNKLDLNYRFKWCKDMTESIGNLGTFVNVEQLRYALNQLRADTSDFMSKILEFVKKIQQGDSSNTKNEVLPIITKQVIGISEVNAVNARDLHKSLDSKQDFSTWIKARIEKIRLVQGRDFEVFHKSVENSNGGRPTIEYIITTDIAKHFCMIEMTDKGHNIRNYFIECEKQLQTQFKTPSNMIEALELALEQAKQIQALEQKVESDKPKVEFADKISQANNAISVSDFAKLLSKQGFNIGQNKLFAWLRDNKYLLDSNLPYQKYMERGYFEVIEQAYATQKGCGMVSLKTLITGKGQIYLTNKLRGQK